MDKKLSRQDLEALLANPSVAQQKALAEHLAEDYRQHAIGGEDRRVAEQTLSLILEKLEHDVRRAVAEQLAYYPDLPASLCQQILSDNNAVAIPFLRTSEALQDSVLMQEITVMNRQRQKAIAERQEISEQLSASLVKFGDRDVIKALASNKGASIDEPTLHSILDGYSDDSSITERLVYRQQLPVKITDRLVGLVSLRLQEYLVAHHAISIAAARQIARSSQEKVTLKLIHNGAASQELLNFAHRLRLQDKLTDSLLLRSVCHGENTFFDCAVSCRANVPLANVQVILRSGESDAITALLVKAKISPPFMPVVIAALNIAEQLRREGCDDSTVAYGQRVTERLLTTLPYHDSDLSIDKLIKLLDEKPSPAAA